MGSWIFLGMSLDLILFLLVIFAYNKFSRFGKLVTFIITLPWFLIASIMLILIRSLVTKEVWTKITSR